MDRRRFETSPGLTETDIWEPVDQIGVFASADSGRHWHDALR